MGRQLIAAMVVVTQAATAAAAEAETEGALKPDANFFLESTLVGTIQRTGGILDLRLRYRRALYTSDSEALKDNYWGVGIIEQATPIFTQTGAYLEVQPTSFFRVTAAYELVGYFGVLNSLRTVSDCQGVAAMSATDPRCGFPLETQQKANADYGHRAWVEALLQLRFGRLMVANNFTAERWWFRDDWAAGPSADHWVNEMFNLPQSKQDTVLTNNASVMYEILPDRGGSNLHLMAGVVSDLAHAVSTDYSTHRVGGIAVLHIPEWHGLRDLTAAALVQFYTHDRYTRGPMPFIGLVLSVSTPNFLSPSKGGL